uniref:SWIM-type domain-containing protein n=1 Tax=Amphimedon queenslandica TaxID=400682 RepID=A0A1X7TWJ0_AMPQE
RKIVCESSQVKQYAEFVTPYALQNIQQQSSAEYGPDTFSVEAENSSLFLCHLLLSARHCCCKFWSSMNLPCRHILSL